MTTDPHASPPPQDDDHDQDADAPQSEPAGEVHGAHDGVLDSGAGQGDQDAEPPSGTDQP